MDIGAFEHICKPVSVPLGKCTWCAGGKVCKVQSDGGEVRYYPCEHCNETGIEPPSLLPQIVRFFREGKR
jgi:hypothetical protein